MFAPCLPDAPVRAGRTRYARHSASLDTGLALIPLSAGLILAAPLSRRLTIAFGARAAMAVGMGLTTGGLAVMAVIGAGTSLT